MITNILAMVVVSVLTNTTERVTEHFESKGLHSYGLNIPDGMKVEWIQHGDQIGPEVGSMVPDENPSKKWIRTTVKEVRALSFSLEGHNFHQLLSEKILSDTEVEYTLIVPPPVEKKWMATVTNSFSESGTSGGYLTNDASEVITYTNFNSTIPYTNAPAK